jgi:3-hydroxybutyryl-CoA dehydratase
MAVSEKFKAQLKQAFDETQEGQTYTYRRTFTDGDVAIFCGVTGDFNPYHQDELFSQESFFGRRIIPGLLTGSMLTHIGGMIGFVAAEMHFHFLQPVYVGDTVEVVVTVERKDAEKRRVYSNAVGRNQDGVEVLRATFNGFPSHVRLAK